MPTLGLVEKTEIQIAKIVFFSGLILENWLVGGQPDSKPFPYQITPKTTVENDSTTKIQSKLDIFDRNEASLVSVYEH